MKENASNCTYGIKQHQQGFSLDYIMNVVGQREWSNLATAHEHYLTITEKLKSKALDSNIDMTVIATLYDFIAMSPRLPYFLV